jgi:hypothetical protein
MFLSQTEQRQHQVEEQNNAREIQKKALLPALLADRERTETDQSGTAAFVR